MNESANDPLKNIFIKYLDLNKIRCCDSNTSKAKIIEDCIFILIAFLLQTVEMQCKKMYNKVN